MDSFLTEIDFTTAEDMAFKADKVRVPVKITVVLDNNVLLVCHYAVIKADIMDWQSAQPAGTANILEGCHFSGVEIELSFKVG